ncbi:PREDICTED: profilin-3-like [Ficedula albicollis]|uniref:profilin-3-like n=1 Tax=Ficedula albicollis TaxID=59894 RepID=UPI0007AD84DE|nr:PREDICTED: profilin-3-like [Ficedula albicollis]
MISVLRAKSQKVKDGVAQCWAFLGDSDSPAATDFWMYSIISILVERDIEDEAVVGLFDNGCVWAIKPGDTDQDQKMFLLVGIAIDGKKCGGICEILLVDEDKVMDVRSKGSDSRSIPSGMTPRPLIFLLGKNGVHRGVLI